MRCRPSLLIVIAVLVTALAGCRKDRVEPNYSRPLAEHASALQLTPAYRWPALNGVEASFTEAAGRSLTWFGKPSSTQFFPMSGVTHVQAHASVFAAMKLIPQTPGRLATGDVDVLKREFDLYESVGWDGEGTVLFTGYYSPVFDASLQRTTEYRWPLYTRPPQLESDPLTGDIAGWRTAGGQLVTPPTRAEIEADPNLLGLAGRELLWMKDPFDRYLVHLQGSARFRMSDSTIQHVGYAGANGHEYVSVARALVAAGQLDANRLSLKSVRGYFEANPAQLLTSLAMNPRYVFFRTYAGDDWPAGALGLKVTPWRTLATDKRVFPRGGIVFVDTERRSSGGGRTAFQEFMLDQDAGGAIRAPGRADIYAGVGAEAEQHAGDQYAEGHMYYLILKPDRVAHWIARMSEAKSNPAP